VIFDRSDPISRQQAQRIRQVMHQLKNSASFGYRFDIYTFEGDTRNDLQPLLQVCSPGRAEEANQFYQNPDLIRRDFEEKFVKVLDEIVELLLKEWKRPTSPLIESLRAAAITSFGSLIEPNKVPLRVTVFSDMVQNTTPYSQIRSESDFTQLSKNPVWPSLRPDLRGAEAEIYYLLRPEAKRPGGRPIQNRGHQEFWELLIRASNGRLTKIEPF
jgi:hypothetical protein